MITSDLPLAQEFFVTTGLYKPFDVTGSDKDAVYKLLFQQKSIDCFCQECNDKSIFSMADCPPLENKKIPIRRSEDWSLFNWEETYTVELFCSRNVRHRIYFVFHLKNKKIQKIGQFPSIATLSQNQAKRFQNILGKELSIEFNKAHGLFAHGVGVGAFVYLRRILEIFVFEDAHRRAMQLPEWDEPTYKKARVADKIQLIKSFLPQFLVDNASVYSILSKGVHELSEEECLECFPVVSTVLERVLIKLQALKDDHELDTKLSKEIQTMARKHAAGNSTN